MDFISEYKQLQYVIGNSQKILLFAHSSPDGDTVGANLALKEYAKNLGKTADITCFDPFPAYLSGIAPATFDFPDHLDLKSYDAVIACDSVERGFEKLIPSLDEKQVVVIIDHHPDITLRGDISIIDPRFSSVCEIIYCFLSKIDAKITRNIATYLMIGILGDTGNFQHANTSARIMEIASNLMKKGAPIAKIIDAVFTNKKLSTLKLWGRAFEKSKINLQNGMIITVLTRQDITDCNATIEDIAQVSSILNTVPGTKFSLVLSEREDGKIKGSLRSEEYKGVDVSAIAHLFGGGGHKLASGFEVNGKISETPEGWEVV